MMTSWPIAVTGMAWTTALGDDLDAVWQRLLAGETGLRPIPHTARLRNALGAVCESAPLEWAASDRMTALGLPALRRALARAECDAQGVQMVLGTSLGAFLEGEPGSAPLHHWADTIAAAVGGAPPVSLSTACSSGSDAVLVGAELIRAGAAECVVCGGVDVLTLAKRLAHSSLGSMSPTTLRTFDERHDGTLLGEGAGFLVLETSAAAAARGKRPLALLSGVGSANDAAGMTTPDAAGLGARHAIERSLADAGLDASDIAVINAHGSGTPLNDATEAMAFREVFGGKGNPIVFGTKGNFGHSLGATGAIEAIAVLLALRTQKVPPVYGLEQRCPALTFPVPQGAPRACAGRHGLSLTLGFGGFDTSLVFEVM
ncbi:3-oxoacyl-[acyl-carrier-protein] synthase, KASII [Minicystis rosea]|nr:3-oxoacyl-[acyl-carrier-protein] synthase, KASII [Minicystis rosea]